MKKSKHVLVREYQKILKSNDILLNKELDLKDFRKVVSVMNKLTLNTFRLETIKSLLNSGYK